MCKARVLAFVDNTVGRDVEILLPITYCFEKYLNVEVKYKFIWDIFHVKLWKPDVILLPNVRGHNMYVEAADYGKRNGITILALDSEGNFYTDGEYDIWGYNKKKEIYQDWIISWSNRTAEYIKKKITASYQKRVIVTGGIIFDKYQFEQFDTRAKILRKYNKNGFKNVIGYAGWAFGKLYNRQKEFSYKRFFPEDRQYAYQWIENQRVFVRECLRSAIEQFPSTLFILKKHPKEEFEDEPIEGKNEMNELLNYDNVLYVKNNESIQDLISMCDVWMAFESTTIFEAWLLKKTTIVINQDTNFPRNGHYKGALICNSPQNLKSYIHSFIKRGNLNKEVSEEMLKFRKLTIQNSIGFDDGLNHIRTFYYFQKSVPKHHVSKNIKLNWKALRLYLLMHLGSLFYCKNIFMQLPKLKKTIYVFENRNLPKIEKRKAKIYNSLDAFHASLNLDKDLHLGKWRDIRSRFEIENKSL